MVVVIQLGGSKVTWRDTRIHRPPGSESLVAVFDWTVSEPPCLSPRKPRTDTMPPGREPCDIKSLGVFCLYFAAPRPPLQEPILILNGEGQGPINNLCVPSQVAANYAPQGQALVSITVLDDGRFAPPDLVSQVQAQLADWFGEQVLQWNHLRTHLIVHALPDQSTLDPIVKPVRRSDGVFLCGDYLEIASIEGAMSSGRRAAEAVIQAVRTP